MLWCPLVTLASRLRLLQVVIFREKKPFDDSDPFYIAFHQQPTLRVISFGSSFYGSVDIVEYQVVTCCVLLLSHSRSCRNLSAYGCTTGSNRKGEVACACLRGHWYPRFPKRPSFLTVGLGICRFVRLLLLHAFNS